MGYLAKLSYGRYRAGLLIIIGLFASFNPVSAHHAFVGVFNMSTVAEVEGELTRVLWRNPHVRFSMLDSDGVTWEIESNSVSILRRMDISTDLFNVGDTIRVAGNPALDGSNEMWVNNALLSGGQEVVLRPGVARRWTGEKLGTEEVWMAGGTAAEGSGEAPNIFRVWSTHFTSNDRELWADSYPLTDAAAAVRAKYDQVKYSPIANCRPKGMPWIMSQPYPTEFIEEDGNILFRIEEYDAVRTIYMGSQTDDKTPAPGEPSPLGYSTGRWDGATLVVETTRIDYPQLDPTGIPQGEDIKLVERFKPSADGSRLDYTLTVTDPSAFTEPVTLDKAWIWRPGEVVRPYECTNG